MLKSQIPALPTKQSSRPKRRIVSATARWLSARTVTSPTTASTRSPNCFASSALRSRARSRVATFAPSSRKRSTMARPSPDAPPVTSVTLFSSQPISEKVAQVTRQQHGLFEENLTVYDLERSFHAAQHVASRTDPGALFRIEPRAIEVKVGLHFKRAVVVLRDAHISNQVTRA